MAPAARIDRKVLTPAVNLLGRVAVHLAGAEEEDDEEYEDLELYDDLGGNHLNEPLEPRLDWPRLPPPFQSRPSR